MTLESWIRNPVRIYSVVAAAIPLGAYFLPSGAWPLVLGLAGAIIGAGQGVRALVTPNQTVEEHIDTAVRLSQLGVRFPPVPREE